MPTPRKNSSSFNGRSQSLRFLELYISDAELFDLVGIIVTKRAQQEPFKSNE
jgi:hypothetical protein